MPESHNEIDARATELLAGKVVSSIFRNRENELVIEFEDRTRLFIDAADSPIEVSIT